MAHQRNHDDRRALVVVAHPDDETWWAVGTSMMHPQWSWRVVSLRWGDDPDRRPRFDARTRLGVQGRIHCLDDGPEHRSLPDCNVQEAVRAALENTSFDLFVTHSSFGEFTQHLLKYLHQVFSPTRRSKMVPKIGKPPARKGKTL